MSFSVTSGGSSIFSSPTYDDTTVGSGSVSSASRNSGSVSHRYHSASQRLSFTEKLSEVFSGDGGCVSDRFSCGGRVRDWKKGVECSGDIGPEDELHSDNERCDNNDKNKTKGTPPVTVVDAPNKDNIKSNPASNFLARYHKLKEVNGKVDVLISQKMKEQMSMEEFEHGNHRGWGASAKTNYKNNKDHSTTSNVNNKLSKTTRTENRSTASTKYKDILREWEPTSTEDEETLLEDDHTYDDTYDGTMDDTIDDTYDGTFESAYPEEDSYDYYNSKDNEHSRNQYSPDRYRDHDHNDAVSATTYTHSDAATASTATGKHKNDSRNDQLKYSGHNDSNNERDQASPARSGKTSVGSSNRQVYNPKHNRSFGSQTTTTASVSSWTTYGPSVNKNRNSGEKYQPSATSHQSVPRAATKKSGPYKSPSYMMAESLSKGRSSISQESSQKIAAVKTGKMTPQQKQDLAKTRRERLTKMGRRTVPASSAPKKKPEQPKKSFPYNINHSVFHKNPLAAGRR